MLAPLSDRCNYMRSTWTDLRIGTFPGRVLLDNCMIGVPALTPRDGHTEALCFFPSGRAGKRVIELYVEPTFSALYNNKGVNKKQVDIKAHALLLLYMKYTGIIYASVCFM